MFKIDNYYKIIASTFGMAYFFGIVVGLMLYFYGHLSVEAIDLTKLFYLTNNIYFKNNFSLVFKNSINLLLIPFSYLIASVNFGINHISLLTSSFLGQIKLLVYLISQIFYFIAYIIFSTIGIKILLFLVRFLTNKFIFKKSKNLKLNLKIFSKKDIIFLYVAILAMSIGVTFQTYLSKILFLFLVNFKSIAYVLIVIFYLGLIIISGIITYRVLKDVFEYINKFKRAEK